MAFYSRLISMLSRPMTCILSHARIVLIRPLIFYEIRTLRFKRLCACLGSRGDHSEQRRRGF